MRATKIACCARTVGDADRSSCPNCRGAPDHIASFVLIQTQVPRSTVTARLRPRIPEGFREESSLGSSRLLRRHLRIGAVRAEKCEKKDRRRYHRSVLVLQKRCA